MSAASNLHLEEHFQCSICLDVFTDPVSTPCGHNFCKKCITQHWDTQVLCKCPMCNKLFMTRPELSVNTFIRETLAQFTGKAAQKTSSSSSSSGRQAAKAGEVPCDLCTGTKAKALKSCLVCLVSYCETHLEPHLTVSGLKKHQLVDPVENLESRMCLKHNKPLELFCKTDQMCVCMMCSVLEHKMHDFVPLKDKCEGMKAKLKGMDDEMQQMIQKRRGKIGEIREWLQTSVAAAGRQKAEGVEVFTALKECVERGLKELMEKMEEEEKARQELADWLIKDLEEEICRLMKRSSEVQRLCRSEDHVHILQSFSSLKAAPPTKDWTQFTVRPPSYKGTVARAVAQLDQTLREKMEKKLIEAELQRLQQYAVDVTLDPDTAHPRLILSDDGKQVKHGDVTKKLPDKPERFFRTVCVLGKQSSSSGKFYFEVSVKGKTDWALGVAKESINRKERITLSPQKGFWTIWLRNGKEYAALARPDYHRLSLRSGPERVGVFVDYEEGLVCFYDADTAAPIYSFTGCCFTDKLLPFFSPYPNQNGENSAPLIVCPVNQTA